ncbi:hypothetical protein Cgig2_005402 [Carnegiea gigantea]|uniref:Reverse transcriptase zinc-binding domain-containing protein n=1 Tax=Carnegiea gigantea TaxID=171969 RepID=A0A9Q1Q6S9_9CARY|nr:hypothetical protein Cgig2_005402 [Carnegiea gigantea]
MWALHKTAISLSRQLGRALVKRTTSRLLNRNVRRSLRHCATGMKLSRTLNLPFGELRMSGFEILKEISSWRRKEEILWLQCSRGDSNSKWFHAQATTRRANNYITTLVDQDGIRHTESEEIALVEDSVRAIFKPCDVDDILDIPLCRSWPSDKITWHFTTTGEFNVRSACHMARALKTKDNPTTSCAQGASLWKSLWALNIPPRIKVFGWKMCVGALTTCSNLVRRTKDFNMSCHICSTLKDTTMHALLECPLALEVWSASPFNEGHWSRKFPSISECLHFVMDCLDSNAAGEFLSVLWEIWNSRNRFIFSTPDRSPEGLALRAISFIRSYREARLDTSPITKSSPENWCLPEFGRWKLNFDAGKLGEWGRGLGFIVCDSLRDIVVAGTKQIMGFHAVDLAEAEACLFEIKQAIKAGKCLFFAWSHVQRGGNRATHEVIQLQPCVAGTRIWMEDVPTSITELALEDTCNYLETHPL